MKKILPMSVEFLEQFIKDGPSRAAKVIKNKLPDDSRICGIMMGPDHTIQVIFGSVEFTDDTPEELPQPVYMTSDTPTEARIERLRKALAGLIGAETKEDLEAMESAMRLIHGIEADKVAAVNAIHALLSESNSPI